MKNEEEESEEDAEDKGVHNNSSGFTSRIMLYCYSFRLESHN